MRYQKPSIARLGNASDAIQDIGNGKVASYPDGHGTHFPPSSGGAYDLDE